MTMLQRKQNRLGDYDFSQNGAYFVTICTQDRKPILSAIVGDGYPVPKPIGTVAEQGILQIPTKYPQVTVDRYVIMPDHIHLLLRIDTIETGTGTPTNGTGNPSPTIGNIIGWYKYQVTKQANQLMQTPGEKIFQRSYYDHVIRNQQDYTEIWEYIENNPKKWLLTL